MFDTQPAHIAVGREAFFTCGQSGWVYNAQASRPLPWLPSGGAKLLLQCGQVLIKLYTLDTYRCVCVCVCVCVCRIRHRPSRIRPSRIRQELL